MTIIVFLLILSILILIHEAGHFFTAKLFGIKVEEFGFGFPLTRPIFSFKRGETTYSFYPALIGGFVKLYGEDEAGSGSVKMKQKEVKKDLHRAFFARPIWQRMTVILAGVFMNFALAVLIISFLFSVVGVQIPGDKVIISEVLKNSPAANAGLKSGDLIIAVDNRKITSAEQLIGYTKNHLGEQLTLQVKSDEKEKSLKIIPRKVYPPNEGPMGVAISQNVISQKYPWYQAPFVGTWVAIKQTWLIASGLGTLVTQLVTKAAIPSGVAGPVGIAQLTGIVCTNTSSCLSFISLLSLNLAIINILPIPALDGGRLLFIAIEGIFRKKVDAKIEAYAHAIGMAILLGLIVLITLHDLIRIITGQPIIPK